MYSAVSLNTFTLACYHPHCPSPEPFHIARLKLCPCPHPHPARPRGMSVLKEEAGRRWRAGWPVSTVGPGECAAAFLSSRLVGTVRVFLSCLTGVIPTHHLPVAQVSPLHGSFSQTHLHPFSGLGTHLLCNGIQRSHCV